MIVDSRIEQELQTLIAVSVEERDFKPDDFAGLCELCKVNRMYYDIDLGDNDRYRNFRTGKRAILGNEQDGVVVLYDNKRPTGLKLSYAYYYNGFEYVHAHIEFRPEISEADIDPDLYQYLADFIYMLTSRRNMHLMLEFAELTDSQTGIPNISFLAGKYHRIMAQADPADYVFLRINVKNFRYINETAGANAGNEAIVSYSRKIILLIDDDEGICRMGGDNYAAFIRRDHLDHFIEELRSVTLTDLKSAPGRSFRMEPRIGMDGDISDGGDHSFLARFNEASRACELAKSRFKKDILVYTKDLETIINKGIEILGIFPDALKAHEIVPFFQAKVDMRTGLLVGFEALARWRRGDSFIYPDQFIPVLEKENLIPQLDMVILEETCICIRKWREMGLKPPRISVNFSKKNLYVPDIASRIRDAVCKNGLTPQDIEIEITETLKESEYENLIDFVNSLKQDGFHISVDDFGTGYSSLSLIHNLDVDVIKIDKSFVDKLPSDRKSRILIESVVSIVDRLNFSTIAEGVETKEQGAALLSIGCHIAQGYYYSRPSDFEATTAIIKDPPFEPI